MLSSLPDYLDNIILLCDSYKVSHYQQYPPGTEKVYAYFECRGGKFEEVVFFGLQYILKRSLVGQVVTTEKISEAKEILKSHFGRDLFNEDGWNYIVKNHNGYLPVRIKAVPEGSVIPTRNVLFTVENTDPNCFWLTTYVETILVQVWYPMTVATNSRHMKRIIADYLLTTCGHLDDLPFKLHDFGFRGVSSIESAALGGLSHLVNFRGTDTLPALLLARKFYNCPMAGFSIPATEHSTMTMWGERHEVDAYHRLLDLYECGTFSCVSDSYNVWDACEHIWGEQLREKVIHRSGTLVIRPDSGEPTTVVAKVLDILGSKFHYTVNDKGYKVLPNCVRVIQGDGISSESIGPILESIRKAGWSTENVTFGSGGALLQQLNRDTQKCAFKCSHAVINGIGVDVNKHPITDPQKISKKGRLTLERCPVTGKYSTIQEGLGDESKDLLVPVFENGYLLRDYSLEEVRQRAELPQLTLTN